MKQTILRNVSAFAALIGAASAQSVYQADVTSAASPTITWDSTTGGSGSFDVTYNRSSGTAGPASFQHTYQFTGLSRAADLWEGAASVFYGVEPDIDSIIGSNGANLGGVNTVGITDTANSLSFDVNAAIDAGTISWLGTYSLTTDPAPSLSGLTFSSDSIEVRSVGNGVGATGGGITTQGIFGQPIGGALVTAGFNSRSDIKQFSHSDSIQFEYTAWDDPNQTGQLGQIGRGMLDLVSAEFVYAAVPEPSSILLLGIGGMGLTLRRRRS